MESLGNLANLDIVAPNHYVSVGRGCIFVVELRANAVLSHLRRWIYGWWTGNVIHIFEIRRIYRYSLGFVC
jgi:hypothetical protein